MKNSTTQLRAQIRKHLDQCNASHTPLVCAQIQTEAGYRRIEALVIQIAIRDRTSIGAAIVSVEMELA